MNFHAFLLHKAVAGNPIRLFLSTLAGTHRICRHGEDSLTAHLPQEALHQHAHQAAPGAPKRQRWDEQACRLAAVVTAGDRVDRPAGWLLHRLQVQCRKLAADFQPAQMQFFLAILCTQS